MRIVAALGVWSLIVGAGWHFLGSWLPSASERFYLLIAPFSAGCILILAERPWRLLWSESRRWLVLAGFLFALTLSVGVFIWGPRYVGSPRFLGELGVALYLFAGVGIFLSFVRWLFRIAFRRIAAVFPDWRGVRPLIAEWMPTMLMASLAFPYFMALSYVHRFKFPNEGTPLTKLDRPFEQVALTTDDGLRLQAWFIPAKEPSSRTVVLCHGLGTNREFFLPWIALADELDANVLMFDFRGHGDSDGRTVTLGGNEKHDVRAAVDWVRTTKPEAGKQIVGLGISMGSGALIFAGAELDQPLDAFILDSGFAASCDLTDNILAPLPACVRPWMTGVGMPLANLHAGCDVGALRPEDAIGKLRAPVLIVHSQQDRLIPPSHAERLAAHAAFPKRMTLFSTKSHSDLIFADPQAYRDEVRTFLRPLLAAK
ncbi:MAG: alpha/beta fold hydrolase [Gemmataceae bacterium]